MVALFQTTTFKKSQLSTSFLDSEMVCKSSSRSLLERSLLERSSLSKLRLLTPLITSRPWSKTRKESLLINKDSSSLENNLRMATLSPTITFKKSQLFILSSGLGLEMVFEKLYLILSLMNNFKSFIKKIKLWFLIHHR